MAMMPSPLRALIVDDEAPALTELVRLLGEDARIGAVRTADNRAQALEALERESVDVLLCDIAMPGLDALVLARVLARLERRPHLIFTTAPTEASPARPAPVRPAVRRLPSNRPGAYRGRSTAQRTVELIDLDAVDYVSKPVRPDQLAEAIRRAMETAQDETITVELAGVTRFVRRSQVLYVEAQGDYARLHTATGSHLVRIPLTTLEERWTEVGFLRIHRSTMVALPHVDEVLMDGGRFQLRLGNRTLQVSRRHTRQLRDLLLRGTSLSGDRSLGA
jgi:DNA-binding LytR/AlgR family response regulator